MLKLLAKVATPKLLLIIGSVMLTYAGLSGWVIWQQQQKLEQAQQHTGQLQQALEQSAGTVSSLQQAARQNQQAQAELRKQLQLANASSRQYQQQLQVLKRENEQIKKWAETLLPAAISQLHQRPAITGAAEYRAWLSTRDPLPTAAEPAPAERGSKP